ncbi:selenide, water dikinase SelD [Oceaniglobus ichthyenteri]|uniref:selenide, water dikinase SelD n=1 Tax=Oceaniglobus ichthyenteri TaxID=2136177 RepID=UPI000D33B48A|nr:selenide, water dikinase SelD [Oceaniglobus ichthyenteri]
MTPAPLPLTRDIVLIGGGHAHALVLRAWGMNPLPGARLTLINPGPTAPYTGMLPGFIAGHYKRDELEIDLVRLARFAGARFIAGRAEAIDRSAKTITVSGRGAVAYDVASIDIGIHSALHKLPGFDDHAIPAKPLGRFATAWADHLAALARAPDLADKGLVVIGAGVAGVELAMAMAHGAKTAAGRTVPVTLIDSSSALQGLGAGAARAVRQRLHTMGITLREHTDIAAVTRRGVTLADGALVPAGLIVGAAGAVPYGWLGDTGLALHDGFVRVDATLRSISDPSIFAVGDCAHMDHAPRPKAGVFAVRQAPVLTANLRAALGAGAMKHYRPQRDYLKLISLGKKAAVADKFGLRFEGAWLWAWKNHIDRKFMARLANLPPMSAPKLPRHMADGVRDALGDKPMCGGCGSKLGRGTLIGVLNGGSMDDAAVLGDGAIKQVLSTDHLRAFVDDPFTMARIAANHALGDVFAMGARPQTGLATVILPPASQQIHRRMMTDIMQGARQVFADAGAQIVGGHTLVGDSLSIGFAVTGTTEQPIRLSGAQSGDALVLTKPLGTGVIMAADMALAARGAWVTAALTAMQQSQGRAAQILRRAHGMTDVTGFGLAGHVMGLCEEAGLAATLHLDAIPLLDGAEILAKAGQRSSLFDQNAELAQQMTLPNDPRADLLFDPQTAGGLLAAVAPETAAELCGALCDAGYIAAQIGVLTDGAPHITVV